MTTTALWTAAAIAVVVYAVIVLGMAIEAEAFRILSGALLIAWGLYHLAYGHRHRLRIGLRTGLLGLFAWSFLNDAPMRASTTTFALVDTAVSAFGR